MTWSYSASSTTTRNRIRRLIGDADTNDQKLTDEEIDDFATLFGGLFFAAASCADAVAGKYASKEDRSVGDLRLSSSQKAKAFSALATRLRVQGVGTDATPYAGGLSIDDKDAVEEDSDRVQPAFTREQFRVLGSTYDPSQEDEEA